MIPTIKSVESCATFFFVFPGTFQTAKSRPVLRGGEKEDRKDKKGRKGERERGRGGENQHPAPSYPAIQFSTPIAH